MVHIGAALPHLKRKRASKNRWCHSHLSRWYDSATKISSCKFLAGLLSLPPTVQRSFVTAQGVSARESRVKKSRGQSVKRQNVAAAAAASHYERKVINSGKCLASDNTTSSSATRLDRHDRTNQNENQSRCYGAPHSVMCQK